MAIASCWLVCKPRKSSACTPAPADSGQRRDQPQTPKLDDAKPAAQPASQPGQPEQKAEKPAAPVRNSRKPQLDSYDDEEDYSRAITPRLNVPAASTSATKMKL